MSMAKQPPGHIDLGKGAEVASDELWPTVGKCVHYQENKKCRRARTSRTIATKARDWPELVELSVGYPEFKQGQILQALPCVFVHADQEVTARR